MRQHHGDNSISRRGALKTLAATTLGAAAASRVSAADGKGSVLAVDPTPGHEISPHLYMQIMEPLGVTDSSVEASWDHARNDWRPDLVEATRRLGPGMVRWGGIYTDFYRWREGVGPRDQRPPMHNLQWGGIESNQVGTAEFVDFCSRVGADPLMCVNFESDGRERYMTAAGKPRSGDAREAADWVSYCNDPVNAERRVHGFEQPLTIKHWQIGNETSYDRHGFDLETTAQKTVEFARAMRERDASIRLIGWGDSGWAPRMAEVAGEHLDMLAFHHMFDPDDRREPVLRGERYRRDPTATWEVLMRAWEHNDHKIREVRDSLDGAEMPLAMTECHFAIPGRNRCDVLSTWAAGVSYGRILNNHQRHADVLKIATAADFCGNRWQVNAVMLPTPAGSGEAYLMPVARVMRLYSHHIGTHTARVSQTPDGLDVVASRAGDKLYLHVVNCQQTRDITAELAIAGERPARATAVQIVEEPMVEVSHLNSKEVMTERRIDLPRDEPWRFPAASVSAVEVSLAG
ncbi:Intracellular exo-alpha-(1-_5)-L-arabinofuranosidase [Posidoniimonas polymericola]|uniref:non-reducing end alpha-L-arabinofuranosidase n=1 Tax=Posidoniimonas polymericola TaxID=2528002 RepID=A0A5C5YPZ4_9BACT|nr:alpha-L-arabinofuranosidase C-terminal domain-containing protein [Posidoniimonas polymericola]TWT76830.1 Intracellular exo-alpha-(1->5)-L-arabinofuranosidase [Posidoniimonas polymericola]